MHGELDCDGTRHKEDCGWSRGLSQVHFNATSTELNGDSVSCHVTTLLERFPRVMGWFDGSWKVV